MSRWMMGLLLAGALVGNVAGSTAAAGDLSAPGARQFLACRACHTLQAGGPHGIGPNLAGLLGRPAGTAAGFTYSKALAGSGLTWDEPTLLRWLENPAALVPGTSMAFAGLADPAKRGALVEWLRAATAVPAAAPEK